MKRLHLTALVLLAWAHPALAQVPQFDLERLTLNPGARATMAISSADGLSRGDVRVSLWGHYEREPLVFTVNTRRVGAYVSARVTAQLLAAWGITDFIEVALAFPLVLFQSGDDLTSYDLARPTTTAAGATSVQARVTFLRQAAAPLDVAASVALGLPTGSSTALTRDTGLGLTVSPKVALARAFGDVLRLGGELGVTIRGASTLSPASAQVTDEVGTAFTFGAVVSTVSLPFHLELSLCGEAPFTRAPVGLEVLLGARYRLADFELSALGGPGLGKTPGTPAFRVLAGLTWAPHFAAK